MPKPNAKKIASHRSASAKRFFSFKRKYLAIPYSVFLFLFVIIPILIIVVYAFTETVSMPDGSETLRLSGAAFLKFFSSRTKLNVLVVSLFMGILNTLICLLIGYPIAYLLANKKVNQNYVLVMLFVMPMWINFVLRTGATRDVLSWMGIYGGRHPYFTTTIGLVYNYLPFTILPLYTTMIKLDRSQIEASRDLGCNPFQTFVKSVLPQSIPGIVSAAEMVFMPTMSSYVISDTLSEGKLTLFGNIIYLNFSQSQWNDGSFMALIMLAFIAITMVLTKRFRKEGAPQRGAGLW